MRFIHLYLVGYFVLVLGAGLALWQAGVLARISATWIGISALIVIGLGIILSVLLIGQPELETRLQRAAYAPLRQRIGIRFHLGPLSLQETIAYIEHRVRFAGGKVNPFTSQAMEEIYARSGGIPRLINTLATTALLDAFGEDAPSIDPVRIASAAREHSMDVAHG